jgi:signal transduction histidine kinase/CheY-like chemotaxis protein
MGVRTSHAVLLLSTVSLCLTAQRANTHANFKVFGFESGLPNLGVENVIQDHQGFLWVATEAGLFRYDGERFEAAGDGLGLPEYWPRALHCTRDGALWVGTPKGLYVKRGAHFEAVPIEGVEQVRGRQAIDSDSSGRVYAATSAGLMAGVPGRWRRIWPDAGMAPETSLAVKVFSDHEVWFGCGKEICLWDGQAVRRYGAGQGVPADTWSAFVRDQRGRLYARGQATLVELAAEQARWVRRDQHLGRSSEGGTMLVDPAGRLMVATDYGLAMSSSTGWRHTRRTQGLPVSVVTSMYEDREGNIWVATNGGGLARWLGYGEWEAWTEAEGLASEEVWSILPGSRDRYWIGTVRGISILERTGEEWRIRQPKGAPRPYRILTMVRDQQGRIWVPSARAGFERADELGGGPRRIGEFTGANADLVMSAALDTENRLWAATKRGLYRSTPLERPEVRFDEVVAPGQAARGWWWTLARGPDGTIWAGGKQGLLSWRRDKARLYTRRDGLLDDDVYQILPVGGEILTAYDSRCGLTRLRPGAGAGASHVTHERIGAQYESERFYSLTADHSGKLYAGTGNGVLTFDGRKWGALGMADGLVWADCSSSAILTDKEGAIWIGTSRGLSRYLPNPSLRRRFTPAVTVTAVLAGGRPLPDGDPARIAHNLNSLDFQYAGLTFTDESGVLFRYRLRGLEERWVETRARAARYPALAPGKYRFQVLARSAAGVWSEYPAEVDFEIQAPWWQSWWFAAVCAALIMLAGRAAYLWRINVILQRQKQLKEAVRRGTREIEGQKAEIERLLKKSEQASQAKSEFLANVSHELRTPLTGVLGMAELVLQSEIAPPQRENLGILKQSAAGLLSIVNDILDLSKIEAGRMDLNSEVFNLRGCVEDAMQTLAAPALGKGLRLAAEWEPGVPAYVLGDALRLRQILLNLLGNALKFTDAGSILLRAGCQRLNGVADGAAGPEVELRFSVTDTGAGIVAAQQEQIFEAFRQADNSKTRRHGGTGLGLAICKRLTALMNGRIWVESAPGVGSTFLFTVRMREAAAEAVRRPRPARVSGGGVETRPRRILLVEDNLINRKVVVGLLEKHGHRIDTAENGRAALEMLRVGQYELVLMDVQMPEMDGLEATRRIRQLERGTGRHLPVVGLTALAMLGDREACLEAGMDECVYKPIDVLALLAAIEEACAAGDEQGRGECAALAAQLVERAGAGPAESPPEPVSAQN